MSVCWGWSKVIDFLMMPKGKVVHTRSSAKRASPRRVGQKTASPWADSRGPTCITHAPAGAMSRPHPRGPAKARSSM
jgi:hypothetical protein